MGWVRRQSVLALEVLCLAIALLFAAGCSCSEDPDATDTTVPCKVNDDCPGGRCALPSGKCVDVPDDAGKPDGKPEPDAEIPCDPATDLCGCDEDCSLTGPGGGGFDLGDEDDAAGVGVNNQGQLILDTTQINTRIIWIANTQQGTVAKIDTTSFEELARYQTGPNGPVSEFYQGNDPSRTSVNSFSDVYVGNRADRSVLKIAALTERCADRNNDGVITTSTGQNDIKSWTGDDFSDECIQWRTVLPGLATDLVRAVAAQDVPGPDGTLKSYVWVGVFDDTNYGAITDHDRIYKLDGETGAVLLNTQSPTKPYGFALDAVGNLWIGSWVQPAGRLDTNVCLDDLSCDSAVCEEAMEEAGDACVKQRLPFYNGYGITVDAKQRVWLAGEHPKRYDPSKPWDERFTEVLGDGVALTGDGLVTRGIGVTDKFAYLATAAWPIVQVPLEDPAAGVTLAGTAGYGIGVDADGKVWGINSGSTRPWIITPTATLGNVTVQMGNDGLVAPYTYSDMTGQQLRIATNPRGYYRQRYLGCPSNKMTLWTKLGFDIETPAGTTVAIRMRTAKQESELAAAEWITVATVPGDESPVDLSAAFLAADVDPETWLEVDIQLIADVENYGAGITPVVKSFGVAKYCEPLIL